MPRPKGVPNKNKRGLLAQLKLAYGDDFHPIMKMAQNAVEMQRLADESGDDGKFAALKEAQISWGRIAEYTEPKLKATEVDITSNGNEVVMPVVIEIDSPDSEDTDTQ